MTGGVYPGLEETPEKEKPPEKPPLPTYPEAIRTGEDDDASSSSWQRSKGVLACNRHMLENQLACDIWFTVGTHREKVGAHRYVLQSRSGVFFAMLDGPGAQRDHIDLPEAEPNVFWQLLRYMYYEELYPESDSVFNLLALAEKYDVVAVRDICLRFLPGCLTVQTACDILETAHRYDDEGLNNECLLYIRKHGQDVIQTEGTDRMCRECLNKILTMEGLDLNPTERKEVTERWARKQCEERQQEPSEDNKQESLGDVLYVKRDPKKSHRFILDSVTDRKMSVEEEGPPPLYSELSMEDDVPDDASVSSAGSKHSLRSQVSRQLSTQSWPDLNHVTRFKEIEGTVDNEGIADAISFTVDQNVYLYGFGIYGSKKPGEAAYKVDTVVTRKKKDILLESISISGAGVILPVMFEKPVKIQKGKPYTLEIYVQGPPSHCGAVGLGSVSHGRVTFKFTTATAIKKNRTTDQKGQIPRLYFLQY